MTVNLSDAAAQAMGETFDIVLRPDDTAGNEDQLSFLPPDIWVELTEEVEVAAVFVGYKGVEVRINNVTGDFEQVASENGPLIYDFDTSDEDDIFKILIKEAKNTAGLVGDFVKIQEGIDDADVTYMVFTAGGGAAAAGTIVTLTITGKVNTTEYTALLTTEFGGATTGSPVTARPLKLTSGDLPIGGIQSHFFAQLRLDGSYSLDPASFL